MAEKYRVVDLGEKKLPIYYIEGPRRGEYSSTAYARQSDAKADCEKLNKAYWESLKK